MFFRAILNRSSILSTGNVFSCPRIVNIDARSLSTTYAGMKKKSIEESIGLPRPPTAPLVPYFKFITVKYKTVAEKFDYKEKQTLISKEWEELTAVKKEEMSQEFKDSRKQYEKEYEVYHASLSQNQQNQLRTATRLAKSLKKKKTESKEELAKLGKPKHPLNPYIVFFKSLRESNISLKLSVPEVAARWNALSEQERKPIQEDFSRRREIYDKELTEWEDRMIKEGRVDVVRKHRIPKSSSKDDQRKAKTEGQAATSAAG